MQVYVHKGSNDVEEILLLLIIIRSYPVRTSPTHGPLLNYFKVL